MKLVDIFVTVLFQPVTMKQMKEAGYMIRPDSHIRTSPLVFPPPAREPSPLPAQRLLVLIPDADSANTELARRIWELAVAHGFPVLLLGLCMDATEEILLRRQLVTMAAAIRDSKVSTQIQIEFGQDWIEKVRAVWRPGDLVVCFAEQQVGLRHKPLSQVLNSGLQVPVYILSGLYVPDRPRSSLPSQIVSWAGSIGILLGFFWVQVKIDQLPKDWTHTFLLCLSVFVEIVLIWMWNSLTA